MRVKQSASTSRNNASRSILKSKTVKTFESVERKRRKRKPGAVALREIKYYQSNTDLLLRVLPFARLVKEICNDLNIDNDVFKWKASALQALQYATEMYITALFTDVNKVAIHAKRVTIRPEDMHIVLGIKNDL